MRATFDAAIIGAGPAGCAAATLLARAGWSVALVEKQTFPRRKVCGECIAASNLPLLDSLGVGAAFAACAGPELRQVALMRGDACVVADLPQSAGTAYRYGRALGRETFDSVLLEQAEATGVCVFQPWQVSAIDTADAVTTCTLQAPETRTTMTLHSRVLIAANGSWEALPSERAAYVNRRASDLLAFKANFDGANLSAGLLPVLSFAGGYGGMVVADDGLTTVACCVRRDRLQAARRAAPGQTAGDVVEGLLKRECAGVRDALHTAARIGPWIAAGPLRTGIRLCNDETLLRIGNAAGEAHPIIGEGISMALQSAFLLCACLLREGSDSAPDDRRRPRAVVRAYNAAWRRAFVPRLVVAAAFAHAAMGRSSSAALLALARLWPGLLTSGARWGGKVDNAADTVAPMLTRCGALPLDPAVR
jgi:2-polyprenyl-6-methoxyphenol hydroxylase-like FAD-dependent oxidoreductase